MWLPSTHTWAVAASAAALSSSSSSSSSAGAVSDSVRFPGVDAAEIANSHKQHYGNLEAALARDQKRLAKRSTQLNSVLGSKIEAAEQARQDVVQAHSRMCSAAEQLAVYSRLLKQEERSAVLRLADEQELLDRAVATERELQRTFSDLNAPSQVVA